MNKHDKISKLLAASALGELSPEAQAEVKTHLAECHQCSSELKRLQTLLECTGRISELSPDARMCESAKQAIFSAVESGTNQPSPGPKVGPELIWRTIMYSKTMKLAAAAVIAIVVLSGISFWPIGNPENGKWWLASPAVWSQEIMATLDAFNSVSCREQIVNVMPDGSEHTSMTWDIYYASNDSYRRDIHDGDDLREIQWYVPDGAGTRQHSIRFDLKSYFTHTGEGSFGNYDPVDRMRFYVGLLDEADRQLGTEMIDGCECVGFEISASKYGNNPEQRIDCIWFDVETKLPVRIEKRGMSVTGEADMTLTIIQDQFDYDPGLSADTFIPYTPEGFVFGHPDDIRAAREK